MSTDNPIPAEDIPLHMLEEPRNAAQKKAFAKVKRAQKAEDPKAKRSGVKRAAESGYQLGAEKNEKP